MRHYIRIYWMIIKINFSLLLAYRANFYNSILIALGWGTVSVSSIFLITAKTSHIYNWNREDLYLLVGFYSILVGIFHMFFSSSFERFGQTISLGELDTYLLMPIDAQWYLSTKVFRPVSFLRVLIGVIFTAVIISRLHNPVHVFSLLFVPIFIIFGIFFLYSLWFLVVTIMIWNPNLTNLIDFLYVANNFGRYPSAIVTYTGNIILYFAIPLMLITTVPVEFVLGKTNIAEVLVLSLCALCLTIASRYFWKFALKHYVSASS